MNRTLTLLRRIARPAGALLLAALAPAAAAAAVAAPGGRAAGVAAEPLNAGSLLQVTLGLAAVVVTIFALAWFLRRYGRLQTGADGALRVVGGLSVGPREKVVLVQVHGRQLVLGVAPGRVQMLHVLDGVAAPAEPAQDAAAAKTSPFAALLNRVRP